MFGINNFIWTGVVLYILAKVLKIPILEKLGFVLIILGAISMLAGFFGFGLPF